MSNYGEYVPHLNPQYFREILVILNVFFILNLCCITCLPGIAAITTKTMARLKILEGKITWFLRMMG